MEELAGTIIVSLAAVMACLVLRPATALGIVIASTVLWPEYLRIPMGIAQMSAPRLAALTLFIRLALSPGSTRISWRWPDTLVLVLYLWLVVANLLSDAPELQVRTVIGSGFDTLLMYQVGRRACYGVEQSSKLVWGILISAIVLAPLALYENATRSSPYISYLLGVMGPSVFTGGGSEVRLGLFRAFSSTQIPIYFGLAMMMAAGIAFAFRESFRPRWMLWIGLGAAVSCVFSSISSGPWLGLFVVAGLNAFYWQRRFIVPCLYALVAAMISLEFLSNRHFYNLIDRIAMDSGNAYYRSRLMEVAIHHLDEYWLFGAAGSNFEHWGREIDYRNGVDMVNNYLIVAVAGGVMAVFLYLSIKVAVLWALIRAFRRGTPAMRPVAFSSAVLLVGLSFSEMSVGLYGPALIFSYILMGYSVSMWQVSDDNNKKLQSARADGARRLNRAIAQAGALPDAAGQAPTVRASTTEQPE